MAGTVPAGCRAAPGTMHPLPPRRGERLGTALLPCWQQGHLHTASVPHGRKVLPMGVQPRDPETAPEGLMSREMVAQGWGLVSLRGPQGRVGGQELIPGTQAAFPGGFPRDKGVPSTATGWGGEAPPGSPSSCVGAPWGQPWLPGVPHTHGHQHKHPLQHPPHSSAPPAHTRGLSHEPDPPHIPPAAGGAAHTPRSPPRRGAPHGGGGSRGAPHCGMLPTPPGRTPAAGRTPRRAPAPEPPGNLHKRCPPQTPPNLPQPPRGRSPGSRTSIPDVLRAPPGQCTPRTKAAGAPRLLTGARCLGGCFWARLSGPCRGNPPWCRCRRTAAGRRRRGGPGRARRKPGARRRPAAPPGPPPPPRGSGPPPWQREKGRYAAGPLSITGGSAARLGAARLRGESPVGGTPHCRPIPQPGSASALAPPSPPPCPPRSSPRLSRSPPPGTQPGPRARSRRGSEPRGERWAPGRAGWESPGAGMGWGHPSCPPPWAPSAVIRLLSHPKGAAQEIK